MVSQRVMPGVLWKGKVMMAWGTGRKPTRVVLSRNFMTSLSVTTLRTREPHEREGTESIEHDG